MRFAEVLEVAGAALIVAGVALFNVASALIVAGLFLVVAASSMTLRPAVRHSAGTGRRPGRAA